MGILGFWFDLIPLHLALNAIVFALVAPHLALSVLSGWPRPATPVPRPV